MYHKPQCQLSQVEIDAGAANLELLSLSLSAMKFAGQDVKDLSSIVAEAHLAFRTGGVDTYCGDMSFEVVNLDLFPFLELNIDQLKLSLFP